MFRRYLFVSSLIKDGGYHVGAESGRLEQVYVARYSHTDSGVEWHVASRIFVRIAVDLAIANQNGRMF
jgi:hypothetical protein